MQAGAGSVVLKMSFKHTVVGIPAVVVKITA